ncbi:MAG: bacillithiol system redox-active protein YtxJ [Balneolaceae bacterium]|nr:bacillithiol system redox-active protein YtxJ [Balneolaceae bacterium]
MKKSFADHPESDSDSLWVYPDNKDELSRILETSDKLVLVYKHSNRCATCLMTMRVAEKIMREFGDRLRYIFLDVIHNRDISSHVAEMTSVRHESPQVILINDGITVMDLSHGHIGYETLQNAINKSWKND